MNQTNLTASEESSVVAPNRRRLLDFMLQIPVRPSVAGHVHVSGNGDRGQLGLGELNSTVEQKHPTLLPGIVNVVDIKAGAKHSLLLLGDGLIYTFGSNDEGALGRSKCEFEPHLVELPGKAVKVSTGNSHSVALLEDGRVFAWGVFRDSSGNRLGLNVSHRMMFCDIASGSEHLVMLDRNGRVYTMGASEDGQLGRDSVHVPDRPDDMAALLNPGQVILPHGMTIDAIWATNCCTFMRESQTNEIWACGLNNYCQLGKVTSRVRVNRPLRTNFEHVKDIAGGRYYTVLLKNDGTCCVVGLHHNVRLGLGHLEQNVTEMQPIYSLASQRIRSISCTNDKSFAITDDGKLYFWGMRNISWLSTDSENHIFESTPVVRDLAPKKRCIRVACGRQHKLFLVEGEPNESSPPSPSTAIIPDKDDMKNSTPQSTSDIQTESEI